MPRMLPVSPAPPMTVVRPPTLRPKTPAWETFQVVHHRHSLPGPRVLLPRDYRGITGDTHATTRNLGPLALAFTKAGLAVAPPLTQIFFICGVGVAWGFGLRQSVHSAILQTRALRALRLQKRSLEQIPTHTTASPTREALLDINRTMRAEAQVRRAFGGVVASAAGAGTGLGWLFRAIAVGTHTTALAHVATPILSTFFPILGLSNAGLAVYEAVACGKTFAASRRAKRAVWPRVLGDDREVRRLLRARHIERRWCHLGNAVTHACVAVGAPLTFFLGPIGFSVLIPGVLGNLAVDVADQRIIHYPNQLSHNALHSENSAALATEIVRTQAQYRVLHRLRRERHALYPRGLGINIVRPFAQGVSAMRRLLSSTRTAQQATPACTLERIAGALHAIACQHFHNTWRLQLAGHRTAGDLAAARAALDAYDPRAWQPHSNQRLPALYALLQANQLCEPFAKNVLEDRAIRTRIARHGAAGVMRLQSKRWHIDVRALLTQSAALGDAGQTQRLLAHGEEVLLVQGKNAAMFRRRQLLDLLDAHIKQSAEPGPA